MQFSSRVPKYAYPSGRLGFVRRPVAVVAALATAVMAGLAVTTPAQASAVTAGYRDFSYGSSVTAPTGQKPQSKVWYADGTWWGVLYNSASAKFQIYRFNASTQATNAWTTTGVSVDSRRNSQADALWDNANKKLYLVSALKDTDTTTTDRGLRVERFGYDAAAKTYTNEINYKVADKRVEAAVLDKDSTGTLWVTYTYSNGAGGRKVVVTHTTTSDTTWVTPYTLPVADADNLSSDDIATVVAYGDGGGRKVGVLWSNQAKPGLFFASHEDGAGDQSWTRTTLCSTTGCPDDHLNIKSIDADTSGNLYAVVKTSLNDGTNPDPNAPLMVVYRLNTGGSWSSSTAWRVSDDVTRAIIVLDTQNRQADVFASGPGTSGGTIFRKAASFDDLSFPTGLGTAFIKSSTDTHINNPTSTKQSVNAATGLLVVASDDVTHYYVHNLASL